MLNPNILAAIENGKWAITKAAMRSVVSFSQRELKEGDYELFHKMNKETKEALVADIGSPQDGTLYSYIRGDIGIMYVDGPIVPRASFFAEVSGMTSIERLKTEYLAMVEDEDIREILLVMDSPGGNVVGVSDFTKLIKNSGKATDVFVYGMAASAAYWVATGARSIYISDTGEVGSIGVVCTYRDTTKADKDRGIQHIEIVSSQSPYKRVDVTTDEGKAKIQENIDSLAEVFVSTVATNREVTEDTVLKEFGQGGMFVAKEALKRGMVDGITTLDELLTLKLSGNSAILEENTIFQDVEKNASINNEGGQMAKDMNEPSLTATEIRVKYPEATAAIEADAISAEHGRMKKVEALASSVSAMGASAVSAANKVISTSKYDSAKSAGDVSMEVMAVANEAISKHKNDTAADARNLAADAEKTPSSNEEEDENTDSNPDSENKEAIAEMAAAL